LKQRIRDAWPDLTLQIEAKKFGECQNKNKAIIPALLRLMYANQEVFSKLGEIQRILQLALVPYKLWPLQAAIKLEEDFKQVSR
jgi:hypothetical protein